jgi:DNA-directed RNA polymerase subunit beta'
VGTPAAARAREAERAPRAKSAWRGAAAPLFNDVEVFEARKPRETAVISEVDGAVIKHRGIVKGQREIIIVPGARGSR